MKIKVTVTTIREYETPIGEDYYPVGATEEDILKIETDAANDDPFTATEGGETTITVEKIA